MTGTAMTSLEAQAPSMSVLSSEECYTLLGTRHIGRLGVIAEHYPLIIPMNYALDHRVLVVRSQPGVKLSNTDHANVTFQVDDIDDTTQSGWTVLVRGLAEEVTPDHSDHIIENTHHTNLTPWAPHSGSHWVRIIPQAITGRRITPGTDPH